MIPLEQLAGEVLLIKCVGLTRLQFKNLIQQVKEVDTCKAACAVQYYIIYIADTYVQDKLQNFDGDAC